MSSIQVGNAPCSWGTLEFEGLAQQPITYIQMLDELAETDYTGTELGDWGFMPTDPTELSSILTTRNLTLTGAYVGVRLEDPAHHDNGEATVLRTARLLAAVAGQTGQAVRPFLVLAGDNGSDPLRTQQAGRITPEMGLSVEQWRVFADGANRIAAAVRDQTGLRTAFHPHCAGWVETPDEIARFLDLTDPALLGIVFDTGHYAYGAGGCATIGTALERFADRIWYVHFKDCHPGVLATAHQHAWDYFEAVRNGVFCELGQGCVDFPAVLAWLHEDKYEGFITVEQDVLPGMGTPKESAARNRTYLRSIGLEGNSA
ncbi:MAG: xylose isomerase [Chloroflexi bacterium]|nr:MAG: xylose isomerase [Chloroflexota bacterium]